MSRSHGPLDRVRAARDAARQREAERVALEERCLAEYSDPKFADFARGYVGSLGYDAVLRLACERLAKRRGPRRFCDESVIRCGRFFLMLRDELDWLAHAAGLDLFWEWTCRFLPVALVLALLGGIISLMAP